MKRTKIGIIGCGAISGAYLSMCPEVRYPRSRRLRGPADRSARRRRAAEFNVPSACTVEELLADPEIGIVVNLTIPKAHYAVAMAAMQAGKTVESRSRWPSPRSRGQRRCSTAAKAKGVRVGCAPDTFLGARLQTCRKAHRRRAGSASRSRATAFMLCHGHESWHPDPEFYYKAGGGPMFDMGPYYLTALVNLIGPVRQRHRLHARHFPGAHHHQPAESRHGHHGRRAHARGRACSTSPTALSAPLSPASMFGRRRCRASRSTARKARSACPTLTAPAAR